MSRKRQQSGQVLVLFVGGMVGLLALAALAIDLSTVDSLQRTERAAADAAALAGAQDLQTPGSRAIGTADQVRARTDALNNLVSRFGATSFATTTSTGTNCTAASGDISDCALVGTPYWVSIKTPSPSAVYVEASRAVMVTVRQPDVPLSIAHLFGQHDWNVAETSVAGLNFAGQYAVITLRPPTFGRTGNPGDITINGTGSAVNAINGDIGMNTGATLNGNTATVSVTDGYYVRYYAATTDESTPPGPSAYKQLTTLIPDPKYPIPLPTGVPAATIDTIGCSAEIAVAVANNYPAAGATCYKAGVFSSQLTIKNGATVLLERGVYFFASGKKGGILNQGILIGGYNANSEGVALVVPQDAPFTSNGGGGGSANVLALNRGAAYDPAIGGQEATAALTIGGVKVETNTTPPMVMTVIVPGDLACTVTVPAPNCTSTTINWTGSGNASITAVSGATYAPSDNVAVAGNDPTKGYIGQLVAWTITYSGGSTLNQHFPGAVGNGILRLDLACSGGNTPCSP